VSLLQAKDSEHSNIVESIRADLEAKTRLLEEYSANVSGKEDEHDRALKAMQQQLEDAKQATEDQKTALTAALARAEAAEANAAGAGGASKSGGPASVDELKSIMQDIYEKANEIFQAEDASQVSEMPMGQYINTSICVDASMNSHVPVRSQMCRTALTWLSPFVCFFHILQTYAGADVVKRLRSVLKVVTNQRLAANPPN